MKATDETCDRSCVPPFLRALQEHFGPDAELPTSTMVNFTTGQATTLITPPEVKVRKGRKWLRSRILFPFCAICGKAAR